MGDLEVTYAALQGMIVALDGSITYDFEGHIKADGLDLDASTTSTPPSDERIRWLRKTDGALVADISAFEQTGIASATLESYAPAPDTSANALIVANGGSGKIAELRAHMTTAGVGSVIAYASGLSNDTTLIDSTNQSDYMRGSATGENRVCAGGITPAGAVNYGAGFSVNRTGVGVYAVTYNAAFTHQPATAFGSDQGAALQFFTAAPSTAGFTAHVLNAAGAPVDAFFNFTTTAT